ncbi:MAG: hypothetical protein ABH872_02095 [Candidatus Omnitrophota bacterium]
MSYFLNNRVILIVLVLVVFVIVGAVMLNIFVSSFSRIDRESAEGRPQKPKSFFSKIFGRGASDKSKENIYNEAANDKKIE